MPLTGFTSLPLEQAVTEAMAEMRTQLSDIDRENKKILEDGV